MNNSFRYDINGLRAYAVILVVLFHFGILGFSGGFIGVDIFFVISGFLMTKIITDQIQNKKFSLIKFYLARGIRILPALLFLTFIIAIIGWFILIPEEYKNYAKHAFSSINFLSNLIYYKESGDYFSIDTHNKILLHTWSLSVEWQFYIILPIVLIFFSKISKSKNIFSLLIVGSFVLSLILSYIITQKNQMFSFYMIPTRAWEMLAGGLVYLYCSKINLSQTNKYIFEYLGFSFIIISLILFKSTSPWPSINATLPVVGTMLIIISNNQHSLLTKPKLFQFFGNSSYSIYLWHWPIVFFLSYLSIHSPLSTTIAIILSVFLGWLSYHLIEKTTRKKLSKLSILKSYSILIFTILCLSIVYIYIYKKEGFPDRASKQYIEKTALIKFPFPESGWCFYSVDNIGSLPVGPQGLQCHIGSTKKTAKSVLLFGDSYAGHNIPFWDIIGKKEDLNINSISTNWCYPSLDTGFTGPKSSRAYQQCLINRKFLKENFKKYDAIILAGRWATVYSDPKQVDELQYLIKLINQADIPLIIMDSPHYFGQNIGNIYKRSVWLDTQFQIPLTLNQNADKDANAANHKLQDFTKEFSNILYLSRDDLYAKDHIDSNRIPYSVDGGHISIHGSQASAHFFMNTPTFLKFHKMMNKINSTY
ncbi:acyltransferase [Acinetobacter pittii]|uniref:acyltransferase family protein n=1 Tax=Acinetobacter pittii TaxID=48296 RepID=UPI0021D0FF7E|nr:acyltransferase family protein [Acinetobacter pittii]MCU4329274.1 acyltransferase [Acinetobacter pittii]